ncbi:MAG: alpha/beta fold hydrolase [Devosia sp.]
MFRKRVIPPDHPAFTGLPVQQFAVGPAGERIAVHVSGRLTIGRAPLVCIAGYQRNMSDFSDFLGLFHRNYNGDWPLVLIDFKGRGRSSDRANKAGYVSTVDANDLWQVCSALGIEGAIFLGQGYGGQVVMALAAQRPRLIAGAILIDAGPVSDSRGLVRLRNNLADLDGPRSAAGLRAMFRRMLASGYPGIPDATLDILAARTHYLDKRGRVKTLFDPHLIKILEHFEHDDVLVAQWPLFHALDGVPLMLMRTQLTDQLRRETFEEMLRRRRDAEGYIIEGQASPALLSTDDDVEPIADFVRQTLKRKRNAA